nr:hypothetical protein [Pseudomonas mendocina]
MNNADWQRFLKISRRILGKGASVSWASDSWCGWTTFGSLQSQLNYWARGLPNEEDILETCTADGGVWMQPFHYEELAHFIIPAEFYWEKVENGIFTCGHKKQDIVLLSNELHAAGIAHRLTDIILEIKLY